MEMPNRKVHKIESKISLSRGAAAMSQRKRRVAAYARVSTDSDEQLSSFRLPRMTLQLRTGQQKLLSPDLKISCPPIILTGHSLMLFLHPMIQRLSAWQMPWQRTIQEPIRC